MQRKYFGHSYGRPSKHTNCKLKNHFAGAMREVVGFLDLLASRRADRFVFARPDAIAKRCKKYQTKELHGKRWVQKILAELRRRGVISEPVVRLHDLVPRRGFFVATHQALCCRHSRTDANGTASVCFMLGRGTVATWPAENDFEFWGDAPPDGPPLGPLSGPPPAPPAGPLSGPPPAPPAGPLGGPPPTPMQDVAAQG